MSEIAGSRYKTFGNCSQGSVKRRDRKPGGFCHSRKSKQQTVSRWEAGLSRPRDKQIPLLAAVLNADVNELLAAAGFFHKTTVVSFDQPFPIDALSPESFERFCRHFLQATYPEARVERAGRTRPYPGRSRRARRFSRRDHVQLSVQANRRVRAGKRFTLSSPNTRSPLKRKFSCSRRLRARRHAQPRKNIADGKFGTGKISPTTSASFPSTPDQAGRYLLSWPAICPCSASTKPDLGRPAKSSLLRSQMRRVCSTTLGYCRSQGRL